jgi:probable rRNA maturation factor
VSRREPRSKPTIDVIVEEDAWKDVADDLAARISRAATLAIRRVTHGKPTFEVAVLLSDDARLRTLNRQHRGKDRPTNVLSFVALPGSGHLGDVAIAYGTVKKEAKAADKPLLHHVLHLTVHGVLHLLGYDHQKPAEADCMETLEAEILAELGIPDPYRPHGCAV